MKNIRWIIRHDAGRIFKSVVAIVVLMGLCLVPCLYAWFNIFSNWDPYGQSATSRIRVSVVSEDKGAEVLGVKLNLGDTIIGALESNDQIGWVFVDSKEEALWRVYSGDCYAALLVPSDFSRDFISFLTLRFEHPQLTYYENGKKNAIAPKITGQAKTAVQNQVNATVLQTLVSGASEIVLALEANGIDVEQLLRDLSDRLQELSLRLADANAALDNLINVANSAQALLLASSTLVGDMSSTIGYTGELAGIIAGDVAGVDLTVRELVTQISAMLQGLNANISTFYSELSQALLDPETYNEFINGSREERLQAINDLRARVQELQSLANTAGLSGMARLLGELSGTLGELGQSLSDLAPVDVEDSEQWAAAQERMTELLERTSRISELLSGLIIEIADTIGIHIEDVVGSVNDAASSVAELLKLIQEKTAAASGTLASMAGSVARLESGVLSAKSGIATIRAKLLEMAEFVDALADSDFLREVMELLRNGPDVLSSRIASPIKVADEPFYLVDSYGSQMSPFYTVLAQWVGALFCAVLLKTRIRKEDAPPNLTMPQHFFGRYALFLIICVAQALITSLGNLLYVDILCTHPVFFVLAAVVTGICFSMINYMLAFTLGAAGLAVSVIVMVLQVAGSGGTYPVEVLPRPFQILYPFMPYKFAMNAMREAVCGFYGLYYWKNLGILLLITLGCVGMAFVLYLPGKWLNGILESSKEKSGIMI